MRPYERETAFLTETKDTFRTRSAYMESRVYKESAMIAIENAFLASTRSMLVLDILFVILK